MVHTVLEFWPKSRTREITKKKKVKITSGERVKREESKLPLLVDNSVTYLEKPKRINSSDRTDISVFPNITSTYQNHVLIHILKSFIFLYTHNLATAKSMIYVGNNLAKTEQDLNK